MEDQRYPERHYTPGGELIRPAQDCSRTYGGAITLSRVLEMTPDIARTLRVDENLVGLVIGAVDPNSDAGRKGLRRGDIILSANYDAMGSIEALRQQIEAAQADGRESLLLRVQRRNNPPRFIAIRLRED